MKLRGLIIYLLIWLLACKTSDIQDKEILFGLINRLHKNLVSKTFNEELNQVILDSMRQILPNSTSKQMDMKHIAGEWKIKVDFFWDKDSTTIMMISRKDHLNGFRRETILNMNDAILFIKRFEFNVAENYGYEFSETFDYLNIQADVLKLQRLELRTPRADTIEFFKKALTPYREFEVKNLTPFEEEEVKSTFANEMKYCKDILWRGTVLAPSYQKK